MSKIEKNPDGTWTMVKLRSIEPTPWKRIIMRLKGRRYETY